MNLFSHRSSEAKTAKWNHCSSVENTSIVNRISSPSAHIVHPLGENSSKPNDSNRQLINNVETIRGGLHSTVVSMAGAVILLLFPNDDCLPVFNEVWCNGRAEISWPKSKLGYSVSGNLQ